MQFQVKAKWSKNLCSPAVNLHLAFNVLFKQGFIHRIHLYSCSIIIVIHHTSVNIRLKRLISPFIILLSVAIGIIMVHFKTNRKEKFIKKYASKYMKKTKLCIKTLEFFEGVNLQTGVRTGIYLDFTKLDRGAQRFLHQIGNRNLRY